MAEELLTREQVDSVIEFAQALHSYSNWGYYSPYLSNMLLQGLNNDSKIPSSDSIRKALADYRNSANEIQGYMEYTKYFDMLFSRTVMSYVNALSFDLQVVCTNAYTEEDYKSSEYQEDKRRIDSFVEKFNYKDEFRKVVNQLMLREAYYVWFRKTKWGNKGMKYALQILPQDRCMLTGYWEKGMLFDFDMTYFLQPGVDIDGFDPTFKKYYNRVFGSGGGNLLNYRPTNGLNDRTGTYAMWTQTSPEDGAWVN